MRSALDFSSWQTLISTLLGLVLVSVVAVGVRLLVMHTVQQRRERANRQINERLKTLIAAYRTLGGSFTGVLAVDPRHLRELRQLAPDETAGSERARRVRDAVEAALSMLRLKFLCSSGRPASCRTPSTTPSSKSSKISC
jgi:type II secretory pathway pseudopilin PulG